MGSWAGWAPRRALPRSSVKWSRAVSGSGQLPGDDPGVACFTHRDHVLEPVQGTVQTVLGGLSAAVGGVRKAFGAVAERFQQGVACSLGPDHREDGLDRVPVLL